jgi:hypothetical protein
MAKGDEDRGARVILFIYSGGLGHALPIFFKYFASGKIFINHVS